MAEAVGSVRVDLFANLTEFSAGLTKAEARLNTFKRTADRVANGLMTTGRNLSAAITAPLAIFGGFALRASAQAQDLQGVFNVTFGEAADDVNRWAVATGDALGRSTQTIQKSAISFKEFFEDFAPSDAAANELSKTFATLTQDFAAFRNITAEQSAEVLLKGLAGSARGLKTLGVDLSDAALQARAVQLGIAGANDKLTEQQKVLARASIIMQATAKVQGEIARSAGEAEEETAMAKERFQELLVTVGDQLVPVFTQFLQLASGLLEQFNKLDDGTKSFIVTAGVVAATVGPGVVALGALGKVVVFATAGIGKLVGIGTAVTAFFGRMLAARAVGAAIQGMGTQAQVASVGVKAFGVSLGLAATAALAAAPAFYDAGAAIVKFFRGDVSMNDALDTTMRLKAELQAMGLEGEALRLALKEITASYGRQKPITVQQAADFGVNAVLKQTKDAQDAQRAAALKSAQDAQAAKADIDKLIAGFGALPSASSDAADKLKDDMARVRDAVFPVTAALNQYQADLKIAAQAGIDAKVAQDVLGRAFVDATIDVVGFRDQLAKLPPELQAIVARRDAVTKFIADWKALADTQADQADLAKKAADAAQDSLDRIMDFGKSLNAQFDPMARYVSQLNAIRDAYLAGAISADTFAKARAAAFAETPGGQLQVDLLNDITSELTDAAMGAQSLGDAVKNLIKDFLETNVIRPFIQNTFKNLFPQIGPAMTAPSMAGMSGFDLGGAFNAIGSFFGFGGTRDKGGPVTPGMSYAIGSGVREVFTADQHGQVTRPPAGGMGAMGGQAVQNFNFYGDDVGAYRASRRQMARDARRGMQ